MVRHVHLPRQVGLVHDPDEVSRVLDAKTFNGLYDRDLRPRGQADLDLVPLVRDLPELVDLPGGTPLEVARQVHRIVCRAEFHDREEVRGRLPRGPVRAGVVMILQVFLEVLVEAHAVIGWIRGGGDPDPGEKLVLHGLEESLDLPPPLRAIGRARDDLDAPGSTIQLKVVQPGTPGPELLAIVHVYRLGHPVPLDREVEGDDGVAQLFILEVHECRAKPGVVIEDSDPVHRPNGGQDDPALDVHLVELARADHGETVERLVFRLYPGREARFPEDLVDARGGDGRVSGHD